MKNPKNDEYQQRPSFWIEGYGCSANFADLEMMAGQLKTTRIQIGWRIREL